MSRVWVTVVGFFFCGWGLALAQTVESSLLDEYAEYARNTRFEVEQASALPELPLAGELVQIRSRSKGLRLASSGRLGAGAEALMFNILGQGVYTAVDQDGDGVADVVYLTFRHERLMASAIIGLPDPDGTVFVADLRSDKVVRFSDPLRTNVANVSPAGYKRYSVPSPEALLAPTPLSFWVGNYRNLQLLRYDLEPTATSATFYSDNVLPGVGKGVISIAAGAGGSLYLVDLASGVLWRVPTGFAGLRWDQAQVVTKEYPRAVKITSDGQGRLYLLVASGLASQPTPSPVPVPAETQPQPRFEPPKIVVFREVYAGIPVKEEEITIGLNFQVPLSPFNGIAVSGDIIYVTSTYSSGAVTDQGGVVSHILRYDRSKRSSATFLYSEDFAPGRQFAALAIRH